MQVAQRLSAKTTARPSVACRATSRPTWLPGASVPSYLDGTLAGDYGFDPLGLAKDPEALRWYQQAELIHARTAMTGVAGILFTSVGAKLGGNFPEWYEAGKVYQESPGAIPLGTQLVALHLLCGFVEVKRWQDFRKPGSQTEPGTFLGFEGVFKAKENGYPGFFDPYGISRMGDDIYKTFKVREIKNGRLAMLAFLGFAAQHAATGKGPIDNLLDHLADPTHVNFATNGVSVPFF